MPLVYYVPEYERDASQTPLDAERLLRLLGVSGKLTGFRYAVYMVERNLRTLIQSCWNYPDHSFLNLIAGAELRQPPTNSQFIDILAAYLRN